METGVQFQTSKHTTLSMMLFINQNLLILYEFFNFSTYSRRMFVTGNLTHFRGSPECSAAKQGAGRLH